MFQFSVVHQHLPPPTPFDGMDVDELLLVLTPNDMDIDSPSPPPLDGMDIDEPLFSDAMIVDDPSPAHEAAIGVHDISSPPVFIPTG